MRLIYFYIGDYINEYHDIPVSFNNNYDKECKKRKNERENQKKNIKITNMDN